MFFALVEWHLSFVNNVHRTGLTIFSVFLIIKYHTLEVTHDKLESCEFRLLSASGSWATVVESCAYISGNPSFDLSKHVHLLQNSWVLLLTVAGCQKINYPKTKYILFLKLGRRNEFKEDCAQCSITCVSEVPKKTPRLSNSLGLTDSCTCG